MRQVHSRSSALILSIALLLSGYMSTLVRDDVKRTAGLEILCAGSEWVDDCRWWCCRCRWSPSLDGRQGKIRWPHDEKERTRIGAAQDRASRHIVRGKHDRQGKRHK